MPNSFQQAITLLLLIGQSNAGRLYEAAGKFKEFVTYSRQKSSLSLETLQLRMKHGFECVTVIALNGNYFLPKGPRVTKNKHTHTTVRHRGVNYPRKMCRYARKMRRVLRQDLGPVIFIGLFPRGVTSCTEKSCSYEPRSRFRIMKTVQKVNIKLKTVVTEQKRRFPSYFVDPIDVACKVSGLKLSDYEKEPEIFRPFLMKDGIHWKKRLLDGLWKQIKAILIHEGIMTDAIKKAQS